MVEKALQLSPELQTQNSGHSCCHAWLESFDLRRTFPPGTRSVHYELYKLSNQGFSSRCFCSARNLAVSGEGLSCLSSGGGGWGLGVVMQSSSLGASHRGVQHSTVRRPAAQRGCLQYPVSCLRNGNLTCLRKLLNSSI